MSATDLARSRTRGIACAVLLLVMLISGALHAQPNVPQPSGDVEPAKPAEPTGQPTEEAAQQPENEPEQQPANVAPSEPADQGGDEANEQADPAADLRALAESLGVDPGSLDLATGRAKVTELASQISKDEKALADLSARRLTATNVRDALAGQFGELQPDAVRSLLAPVARKQIEAATTAGEIAVAEQRLENKRALRARLQAFVERVERSEKEQVETAENRRDAEQAEKEALEALRLAREREEQERDETLKELLARERKLAEELVAVTREHSDTLDLIQNETEHDTKEFGDKKAALLAEIDDFPEEPSTKVRRETVDPVFEQVVQLRRETHAKLGNARDLVADARRSLKEAEDGVADARAAVQQEEGRRAQLESAVGDRRVAVAGAQLNVAQARLDIAQSQFNAYRDRELAMEARLEFAGETIAHLLPLVSSQQRSSFFSLTQPNVDDALLAAREGLHNIVTGAFARWNNLFELDWVSIEVGRWFSNLLWRLIILLVVLRGLVPLVPPQIERLSSALFQRRFFRVRPRFTVKLLEVIHAVVKPGAAYFSVAYLVSHFTTTFPEIEAMRWAVDAYFIYWLAMDLTRVLVLPRWFRREKQLRKVVELHLDETEVNAMSDILGMEIERARKLVRSVQVVLVFTLLTIYIPDLVEQITGITLIWYAVDRVAVFGLFGIVLWVISTWRDDIAAIFARLVGDRVPRVVAFVNQHKGKWWGVVPIAGATVVVIILEIVQLTRRYASDTEAFRRASTFAFRKKIELQAQQREASEAPDVDVQKLPDSYVRLFETDALPIGSNMYVDRASGALDDDIVTMMEAWKGHRRQGSVALIGEAGIGKSTLMNQLHGRFVDEGERVIMRCPSRRRFQKGEVLEYLAELFELEDVPETKADLITEIRKLDRRVLMIDDCHQFFMRRIGGFDGLQTLLDVVNLTDENHFWVLAFNVYAWSYLNRVSAREHYFGRVQLLPGWSDEDIQQLIETRNSLSDYVMSFTDLVVAHEDVDGSDYFYEVVKTSRGYFRYLHEFSDGNPRVAMMYWLHSVRPDENVVHVSLFRRPTSEGFDKISDNHWFVLAALAQHGELDAREIADIINTEEGFCHLALNFFVEKDVVFLDPETERACLTPIFFRQVLKNLMNSNYLYR